MISTVREYELPEKKCHLEFLGIQYNVLKMFEDLMLRLEAFNLFHAS